MNALPRENLSVCQGLPVLKYRIFKALILIKRRPTSYNKFHQISDLSLSIFQQTSLSFSPYNSLKNEELLWKLLYKPGMCGVHFTGNESTPSAQSGSGMHEQCRGKKNLNSILVS